MIIVRLYNDEMRFKDFNKAIHYFEVAYRFCKPLSNERIRFAYILSQLYAKVKAIDSDYIFS